ncbi:AraC family transcriptional regulator [Bradyrhizobium vignae]|uniref:AraC family transcriptional regulator n=1 Tax=Bradyrhizobium vignae TaxID=1549949 RepID=UPI00100B4DF1|nr:AraC family transcriptional regulator [Bradyrhizobium vignae]RXG86212.1 AraC family transcriptional regulator [Bradyrhizobium vignae]
MPAQTDLPTITHTTHAHSLGAIVDRLASPQTDLLDCDDDVIRSLLQALSLAMRRNDRQCAEALRLAIAIRRFGLRPTADEARASARASGHDRQVQALQKWRLKRVLDYIDAHLSCRIPLADLAAVAGLSRMHFASQFRVATGLRPHEFLLQRRVRRAEELMKDTRMSIFEIALTVGFQTQAHFTTVFKRFTGFTPRRWRVINDMPEHAALGLATTDLL